MPITCPKCDTTWNAKLDLDYLKMFDHCWLCDKLDWKAGRLSLDEFVKREDKVWKRQK